MQIQILNIFKTKLKDSWLRIGKLIEMLVIYLFGNKCIQAHYNDRCSMTRSKVLLKHL